MYYLGIDGGGTKTIGVLSDREGDVIRTVKSGPGNMVVLGKELGLKHIHKIVEELLQGEKTALIKWATLGLAGIRHHMEKKGIVEGLEQLGLTNFTLMSDAELLYYAVLEERAGVLLAAGTGSVCLVKKNNGMFEQIGGWGYLLGDEGSGYYIGRQAIRQSLVETQQAQKPSGLTNRILSFYRVREPQELISKVHGSQNPQFEVAACAALVCELAQENEPNAKRIVEDASANLFELCLAAREKLDASRPVQIGFCGSLLDEQSPVLDWLLKVLSERKVSYEALRQRISAAAAGVLWSIEKSGKRQPEALKEKLTMQV